MTNKIKIRFLTLLLVALALVIGFKITGFDAFSLEYVSSHSGELEMFVDKNIYLAIIAYCFFYIIFLSIGAPIGAIMSVVAGYFFGLYIGAASVMFSAMLTATATFFLGKIILNDYIKRRHKERLDSIEEELEKYGFYYVLAIRFSSVFPFFLINLLFGASGISYRKYILGTFLGLIPGTIIYLGIGDSLSRIEGFEGIFDLELILLFLFLALLAIAPVVIKHLRRRKKNV